MERVTRWYDYFTINIYFLGLTTLSQTNGLVLPLLIQQFVGEQVKGSYLGTIRLWTLMVALLFQAFWGMMSDRSKLAWGRRRPFIFFGTVLNLVFVALIGFSSTMQGMAGFAFLFAIAIFSQVFSNAGQAAEQAMIPDLVPENERGSFSGVKAVLEIPLPLILVSFTVGRVISSGSLWGGLLIAMGVLAVTMVVTMFAPEKQYQGQVPPMDWTPIIRLALMTAVFTLVILGTGWAVRLVMAALVNIPSTTLVLISVGIAGLLAMAIAVGLGVWLSVRISVGNEAVKHNPSFTWWVVNRLAFLVGATNLSTFAVYFIQARLGFVKEKAAGPASVLMMVVGVFILLSALPSGWLADRFGHKRLVAISGIIAGLGTGVAILFPNMTIIYVGGCLIGIATGLFFAANWALGTSIVPKEEAGRYLGISNLAGAGAGAVGAYIGGPIADYLTAQMPQVPGIGYLLLFAIYGMLFLLSVAALKGVSMPSVRKAPVSQPAGAGVS